jgi:hypothetical protein
MPKNRDWRNQDSWNGCHREILSLDFDFLVDVWLPWPTQTNTDETGKLQEL